MKKRILFNEVPEGTKYRKGKWSWVHEPEASQRIKDGYGEEYDPKKGKKPAKQKAKKEPESNGK